MQSVRTVESSGDIAFVSHIPQNIASGGGLYTRAIIDLLETVWTGGDVEFVGPKTEANPSRLVSATLAFLTSQPSKSVFAARSGLAKALAQRASDHFGVVCLNSPDALPLIERQWPDVRYILVCHNIEADLFRQQVARLPVVARSIFSNDIKRYGELENRAFRKASLIIAISDEDAKTIRSQHPAARVVHIPPLFEGANLTRVRSPNGAKLRLGFVGRMQWWPNRDAVIWLRENLTPVAGGREIHLYGLGSEDMTDHQSGIIGHGFVEDPEDIWSQIDVALCPMRTGGGLNIKLVEALARGVPTLTTPFGARGLGLKLTDRPGLRVLEGADAWRAFIESDQIVTLAEEAPDPTLSSHFHAETHATRLASALREASLSS